MALDPAAQRANKMEKAKSNKVLKELWMKAFETGRVEIKFNSEPLQEVNCIFNSLADYRKRTNKKTVENYDMYIVVNAVALRRVDDATIVLEKKPERFSGRTTAILNLIQRVPELAELNTHQKTTNIKDILADFGKKD
jgi:hypothetical protein